MRVLLTGSSGYLGTAFLRHIPVQRPDWDLHITLHSIVPSDDMPNAHYMDLRDAASVAQVMSTVQPELIFHTGALNQSDNAGELYETNANGSGYLAEQAAQYGSRLVHLSTDVVFDGQRGSYAESDTPHPITPYGISKADAERNILTSGANAILVRTSLIYGFRPLDPRTRSILRGEMPRLFTDEMRSPIWVDTLVQALLELAGTDYRGVLHVAGTQPLNRYEFGVKLIGALGGDPAGLIPARSAQSTVIRPLDCTLDVSLAQKILTTRLTGVDEIIEQWKKR